MKGTNKVVTAFGGIGVFLTTIGGTGVAAIPEWRAAFVLCGIIGGGLTAMAFYFAKGKDVPGGTVQQ